MAGRTGSMNYGAWAEQHAQKRDAHLRDMEATATDLRQLVEQETGEHLRLSDIHKAQQKFVNLVMDRFRAADKEQAEEKLAVWKELTAINTSLKIVVAMGAAICLGVLGIFFKVVSKGLG